ncbi:MAG: hypothetical protein JWM57_3764, partial [Phycisphaerales bacterium]|nr:hypothetical protein [Phycisphaerales bacterium]
MLKYLAAVSMFAASTVLAEDSSRLPT